MNTVTRKHARIFVEEWLRQIRDGGDMTEAFGRTGLLDWPSDPLGRVGYNAVQEEISELVLQAIELAIEEAFLKAAREVMKRLESIDDEKR